MVNLVIKGNFKVQEGRKGNSKRKMEKNLNLHKLSLVLNATGIFKKECQNYLKSKGKVYATTLSESDSFNSDFEESCDKEGNYSTFMTIAHFKSSNELNLLIQELGEYSDEESLGVIEESDAEEDESTANLQKNYNSLLEKSGEYIRVAKAVVK